MPVLADAEGNESSSGSVGSTSRSFLSRVEQLVVLRTQPLRGKPKPHVARQANLPISLPSGVSRDEELVGFRARSVASGRQIEPMLDLMCAPIGVEFAE